MFSRSVQSVANTNIFARASGPDGVRQYLVYEMKMAASAELAMILPLPVPPRSREDAVRFIALDGYRDFFEDVARAFPVSRGGTMSLAPAFASQALRVVEVGDFEASFVPTQDDFDRLDDRFRLPRTAWEALPAYRDFGFAVFKLKPGRRDVHPMAFEFPRRDRDALFFPTVHVHDGEVHARAHFDHTMYCQGTAPHRWNASSGVARDFVDVTRARGIIDGDAVMHRVSWVGERRNEDVYV